MHHSSRPAILASWLIPCCGLLSATDVASQPPAALPDDLILQDAVTGQQIDLNKTLAGKATLLIGICPECQVWNLPVAKHHEWHNATLDERQGAGAAEGPPAVQHIIDEFAPHGAHFLFVRSRFGHGYDKPYTQRVQEASQYAKSPGFPTVDGQPVTYVVDTDEQALRSSLKAGNHRDNWGYRYVIRSDGSLDGVGGGAYFPYRSAWKRLSRAVHGERYWTTWPTASAQALSTNTGSPEPESYDLITVTLSNAYDKWWQSRPVYLKLAVRDNRVLHGVASLYKNRCHNPLVEHDLQLNDQGLSGSATFLIHPETWAGKPYQATFRIETAKTDASEAGWTGSYHGALQRRAQDALIFDTQVGGTATVEQTPADELPVLAGSSVELLINDAVHPSMKGRDQLRLQFSLGDHLQFRDSKASRPRTKEPAPPHDLGRLSIDTSQISGRFTVNWPDRPVHTYEVEGTIIGKEIIGLYSVIIEGHQHPHRYPFTGTVRKAKTNRNK